MTRGNMGDYQKAFFKAGVVVSAVCFLGVIGIAGTLSSIRGAAHGIWGTILWGLVACFFPAFIAMMALLPKAIRASEAPWRGKRHHFDRPIQILGRILYGASFAFPFSALAFYLTGRVGFPEPWSVVTAAVFYLLPSSLVVVGPLCGALIGQRKRDRCHCL